MNKEKYIDNILLENDRLYKENKELHNKIDKAIYYIRDCCNMDSKWTNLHFNYAQNDMLADQVDDLLEILKDGDVDE